MKVTRIIFSGINNKWYLQIDKNHEIEISEANAKILIETYNLQEVNLNRWE